jgi:hypothetical protein
MIIALAGRRVDAIDAKQHRFPAAPKHVAFLAQRRCAPCSTHAVTFAMEKNLSISWQKPCSAGR